LALYPAIIASAKALCDQDDSDQGGSDAQMLAWLAEDYSALVRRVTKVVPDYYTVQVETEINDDPTSPVGPYVQIRRVERQVDDRWVLIPPADPNMTGDPERLCWRAIGNNIELLPSTTTGLTVRVEYIPAASLPDSTTALKLPDGLEVCLVHMLAKRIRIRLDQSYSAHDAEYERCWREVTTGLVPTTAQPRHISDYSADDWY
jgi:hypothetical protein